MESGENDLKQGGFPTRYLVAIVGAVGLLPIVGSRKVFALVMTHMTSSENSSFSEELLLTHCTVFNTSRDKHVEMAGDTMFLLHSAYYAGLPLLTIVGTVLSTRVSPKLVIASVVMTSGLITLCLPLVITSSTPLLFTLRLLQGALDNIQQSCNTGVLSAWSTDADKSRLFSIYFTGAYSAPAVAALMTAATMCYVNWNATLYIYGALGMVWSVVWAGMIYNTPEAHPSLSKAQLDFHRKHGADVQLSSAKVQRSIPWRHIVTSSSVWSVFTGFFVHSYVYAMLVVQQPQYFLDSFNINIADIGLLTTLPHVGLSIMCVLGGVLSDRLLKSGLPLTFTRKLLFTTGKLTEGLCLIGLFFTSDWRAAVSLITVGVTVGGLAESGYHPLPADLAPQFAGVIAGFVSMGAIGSFVSTLTASFVSGKSKAIGDWQKLFLVSGVLDILAVVMFDVMANADLQPWASGSSDPPRSESERLLPDSDPSISKTSADRLLPECSDRNAENSVCFPGLLYSECILSDNVDTMRLIESEEFAEGHGDVVGYGTCTPSKGMLVKEKDK
ncbi:vesicular glutamate transporter 2.2-like [Littorina saxatilis]|uniref:vesicular glutamate transporter 2.2-like n=1 Tax=Littorina saxatilis TaxID=31220 RepID=UPI0038B6471E